MREKVQKMKIINKNKQHSGLKMSSVETRTAHSRDRCVSYRKRASRTILHFYFFANR
jgi:hypothetical protein